MQLYRLLNSIMGFRFTGGKGAGKKNVIMRAELVINFRGRENHEPQVFQMKHHFNFYEKQSLFSVVECSAHWRYVHQKPLSLNGL